MTRSTDSVMVPRRLLEEFAAYLDQPSDESVEVPGGNGVWRERMIWEARHQLSRYPAALAMLNETARRPGELVSLDTIASESGIARDRFKPELGAMTKTLRRLFGSRSWPVQATQGGDGMYYLMPPKIAEWWLASNDESVSA